MSQIRWNPPQALSKVEERFCSRMNRVGRIYAFLRKNRHLIFDEEMQSKLATMYSDKPRGTLPVPPALLAMVTLLQAYEGRSDAMAVEEAFFDGRWRMVLDCLDESKPPFAQGTLPEFRRRLIEHDLDRVLLDKTVEIARASGGFGPRNLRVALDSAPLWGAARVEDTLNLIGRAARLLAAEGASVLGMELDELLESADLTVLSASSIKAGLDLDWNRPDARERAVHDLIAEANRLLLWLGERIANPGVHPNLLSSLKLLQELVSQDMEPDPSGGLRIRQGVARDRRIAIHDAEMRHGRKSQSRVINGYKRHIGVDLDAGVVLGATVRPANQAEHEAAEELLARADAHGEVVSLHIDRGYTAADAVQQRQKTGTLVVARTRRPSNRGLLAKEDFDIDVETGKVTCPDGQVAIIRKEGASFSKATCDGCALRSACTTSTRGGRSIAVRADETFQQALRAIPDTQEGREALRDRVEVEHRLAHLVFVQGDRARYRGTRKNTFDTRRAAAVINLQAADRLEREAA